LIFLISCVAIVAFLLFMRKERNRIKAELAAEVFGELPEISDRKEKHPKSKENF